MAKIHITDLRLRTIIGIFDWEREHKQDVVVNLVLEYDATQAAVSDNIKDTVDYKEITKKIIRLVEASKYNLLEKLGEEVLNISLENPLVERSTVTIDKPGALRFADSVSVEMSKEQ